MNAPSTARPRQIGGWCLSAKLRMLLWEWSWTLLCRWTPKPLNPWRVMVLRFFGCGVESGTFVHQRARIQIPWNVRLGRGSCLGDRANLYSLDRIDVGAGSVVAQEAYLCTGTHDFDDPAFPLLAAPITVGIAVFVGARAFVLPGVKIGDRSVVGACSVVTRDVPDDSVVAGNPARVIHHPHEHRP
jgi:putative colanic acid biosynthesis acetyltransferase WcaF